MIPLAHQAGQSFVQLLDDLLLAGLANGEIDRRLPGRNPEVLGARNGTDDGGSLEKRLCGNASPMQARSANLVPLDNGDP